jgi:hypothetical protein
VAPPHPAERTDHRHEAVEHAVPGDGHGEVLAQGDAGAVVRDGREHARVHVHDVGLQAAQDGPHPRPGRRVHGQVRRERDAEAVHLHAAVVLDETAALAVLAERRGEHVHLVAGGHLVAGEVPHLRLDATRPWGVAVGHVDDAHPARLVRRR